MEIRTSFRANRNVEAEEEINKLLAKGYSKLGFMNIMVPPSAQKDLGKTKGTAGRYVVRDGEVVQGNATRAGMRSYIDTHSLDPEDLRRHEHLLRRQHFLEPPPQHVQELIERESKEV